MERSGDRFKQNNPGSEGQSLHILSCMLTVDPKYKCRYTHTLSIYLSIYLSSIYQNMTVIKEVSEGKVEEQREPQSWGNNDEIHCVCV
jgi:hypothetical protein